MSPITLSAPVRRYEETSVSTLPRAERDGRLDFWRALCLLDMILVHLVYDGVNFGVIQRTVGEYTRFAAGGFVFVAGLSIGAIFLPRASKVGGRRKVYPALLRRSLYILGVHFAASISFVALDLIRGMRADAPPLWNLIRDVLFLREGGDLLLLYVIVVAFSPLMLELLQRRLWWVLASISLVLFAVGQKYPWALSSPIHQNFPVLRWQLIFTAGALFGAVLPAYTALSRKTKFALAAAAWSISILLWAADFRSDFGWPHPQLPLVFAKVPLSIGEALRYFGLIFAVIFTTDLMWHRIAASRAVALANTVGRRTLAVYVAHVWVVGLLGLLAWHTKEWGAWQMLLAIPAIVACWGVARLLDWNDRREPVRFGISRRWTLLPWGAATAMLAVVISARLFPPPPVTPSVDPIQHADDGDSIPGFDLAAPTDMMTV